MKILRIIILILLLLIISICALLIKECIFLNNLPYNELGRYFDADQAVVYHEQGLMVLEIFLIFGILLIILLTIILINIHKKINTKNRIQ